MRKEAILLGLLCVLLVPTSWTLADNWPHWRGPERLGSSTGLDPPLTWSSEDNVLWKLPLPDLSGSTPIIWEDRLFLNVAEGGKLHLWCVDRGDGSVLWKRFLDDRDEKKRKGNMSSPSPVTDGEKVWAMTGTGILRAFDIDGGELWRRDLQKDYGTFGILHGYSSSPLLHGSSLYVQVLHGFYTDDPSYLLAIDKASGETVWRVERPTDAPREAPDAYTTPALLMQGGRPVIVVSGADYLTGHDQSNGKEIWRVSGLNPTNNPMQRIVASPLVAGRLIFVPSRVRPLLALEAADEGTPRVIWSTDKGPDVPTPAFDGKNLYILTDGGIMWSLEPSSGKVVWGPERVKPAAFSASPVVAGGRVYVTDENGSTTVVAAGPEFEILARNEVEEYTLSSLAVADGRIYLRTAEHLYCIGETG